MAKEKRRQGFEAGMAEQLRHFFPNTPICGSDVKLIAAAAREAALLAKGRIRNGNHDKDFASRL